jgi:hypothetical protein
MTGTLSTMEHLVAWTRDHQGTVARASELGLQPLPGSKVDGEGRAQRALSGEVGRRSPDLKRWRGGWAMTTKRQRQKSSVDAVLELEEEKSRERCSEDRVGHRPFIGGQREVGIEAS